MIGAELLVQLRNVELTSRFEVLEGWKMLFDLRVVKGNPLVSGTLSKEFLGLRTLRFWLDCLAQGSHNEPDLCCHFGRTKIHPFIVDGSAFRSTVSCNPRVGMFPRIRLHRDLKAVQS